ncbi:hypothetical protein TNCV_2567541 [Trichonephila clavipes]|uniref:Uncharacterized protein n=1 Tax=Trichonephila clavipes TaxID=2585209 RepID=A0A8X6WLQ6_TRICX|nr:hypothetical protein TNCV_2567541 [Trichonephila clavipes]
MTRGYSSEELSTLVIHPTMYNISWEFHFRGDRKTLVGPKSLGKKTASEALRLSKKLLRRQLARYHQLTTRVRDRTPRTEFVLHRVATRVGSSNVASRDGFRKRKWCARLHAEVVVTSEHTDRCIHQLTLFETLSPWQVTSEADCLQYQGDLCPPKPYATDCIKYSYVDGYQQQE